MQIDKIFNRYKNILQDRGILAVEEPFRTIISIYSVQGILDNGGFEYLFESKFPDGMTFDIIVKSYENIGFHKMAKLLQRAFKAKENLQKLNKLDNELFSLSDEVWERLDSFIKIRSIDYVFRD